MCNVDSSVTQIVDNVCTLWTQQGRAFTAYEVTKEVQARLTEKKMGFVRHRDLRDYYRDCPTLQAALQNGYASTLRPMENGGTEAWVYHPTGYDASQYQPLDRQNGTHLPPQVPSSNMVTSSPVAAPVMSAVPVVMSTVPIVTTTTNSISRRVPKPKAAPQDPNITEVNKSGEIWVGIRHVKQAGFKPGDSVEMTCTNGVVTFTKPSASVSAGVTTVAKRKTVEQYGNLRLLTHDRKVMALTSTRFRVEAIPDKVTVTSI